MVISHSIESSFQHPWGLLARAYTLRFPQHPLLPYILGTQILSEERSTDGKITTTTRRVEVDYEAPGWLKKLAGVAAIQFIERTTINLADQSMTLHTVNETLFSSISLSEDCTYRRHPENPAWTQKEQRASLEIKISLLGFSSMIESFCMGLYVRRVRDARHAEESMIELARNTSLPK
eukprot:TRINITY_DN926_c0_g1_i1.p1 TRINITY_DN926_c0_g1~~TRINITY_DN926_c0_g1_i1.p1  ORF type:complete len:178 (-),score=19.53 TRINITY_DN926_c0_g1_i1:20-553(-)